MQKMDFYGELAEYLGRDSQLVKAYCQCAPVILAYEWEDQKKRSHRVLSVHQELYF